MEIVLSNDVRIDWNDCNGLLIAGQSGTGKSQTASLVIGQLAYQGVSLLPCDFESPDGEPDALAERISFCSGAYLYPVATEAQEILQRIELLKEEYELRRKDPNRREPWLFIIDEFSAFLSFLKDSDFGEDKDPIASFTRLLIQMRKLNLRALVIGQEFSSGFATTSMRYIRSEFAVKLLHKLDGPNTKMLLDGADINTLRTVGSLRTGDVFYRENIVSIPYVDVSFKQKVAAKIATLPRPNALETLSSEKGNETFDTEAFIAELFLKYGQSAGYNIDYTDKAVLVDFWLCRGYSDHIIVKHLVKGNAQEILELCKRKRKNGQNE
jgi:hypothetical protein